MKIGIVGGTFNPIHLGHLMLGEYAYDSFELDEIWFMPNGNPPHKDISKSEVSTNSRIKMIELAIQNIDYFKLQTYEIMKKDVSYSYETMEMFSSIYPEYDFYFIIGSDSLFNLETWKYPEKLMKYCTILVACRENIDISLVIGRIGYLKGKYKASIELMPMPLLEISSSDIRNRISQMKSIKYIVPDKICNYIKDHKLYED